MQVVSVSTSRRPEAVEFPTSGKHAVTSASDLSPVIVHHLEKWEDN